MMYFQQLISCTDLHAMLGNKDLVILDASIPPMGNMAEPEYSWPEYRIPHARSFDLNKDFSDLNSNLPHTMPSALHFEQAAKKLGINKQSQIVVYDDLGLFSAARAWYMFRAMGHENIAILDGGLPHWLTLKMPIADLKRELNSDSFTVAGDFIANEKPDFFCHWREVEKQIDSQEQLVLDARAIRRFKGLDPEPRAGVRSGHIPNSKNLPYNDLLTLGLFKTVDELVNIFSNINAKDQAMIMSCGSGVTACVLALGAELSGYKNVRVYDGSWSEWGALSNTRIETDIDHI
ncbi:MAG: sulfurtransferase [Cognaticolwellia sp.]